MILLSVGQWSYLCGKNLQLSYHFMIQRRYPMIFNGTLFLNTTRINFKLILIPLSCKKIDTHKRSIKTGFRRFLTALIDIIFAEYQNRK